ncbi:MAG: hypothetical protein A2Y07_09165 [Planctomycetes bacterium GWF2_50_10]|nr:MAG: hypothetical protein A2Y07_09165 [Planctomycetes bacterium GWF2_50_10]
MSKAPPPPEESGEKAPLWIISFADMISLLMAFFVMLQTLATSQSGQVCNAGVGVFDATMTSFRQSINGFGMPNLFGQSSDVSDFPSEKAHWGFDSPEEANPNTKAIDGKEEKIRRIFSQLDSKAKTHKSYLLGRKPQFTVAPINFAPGRFKLNDQAISYLSRLASNLKNSGNLEKTRLYIVGVAPDAKTIKDQWSLSAKRAQACLDYLKSELGQEKANIYSWGSGTGGEWTTTGGPAPKDSQILIAILNPQE